MRKLQLVAIAAMLAISASTAMAQDGQQQGGPRGGRMMAALMNGISLSADQQVKVDSIAKKYSDARQAMMQDQSLDQDARRAKMREQMGKQAEEIKAVLSDEQKKVFDKNREDMQARMQQGGQRPPQL